MVRNANTSPAAYTASSTHDVHTLRWFSTFGRAPSDPNANRSTAAGMTSAATASASITVALLAATRLNRCDPCLAYHLRMALAQKATKDEFVEAIRLAILSGGSVVIPTARYGYRVLRDLKVL